MLKDVLFNAVLREHIKSVLGHQAVVPSFALLFELLLDESVIDEVAVCVIQRLTLFGGEVVAVFPTFALYCIDVHHLLDRVVLKGTEGAANRAVDLFVAVKPELFAVTAQG